MMSLRDTSMMSLQRKMPSQATMLVQGRKGALTRAYALTRDEAFNSSSFRQERDPETPSENPRDVLRRISSFIFICFCPCCRLSEKDKPRSVSFPPRVLRRTPEVGSEIIKWALPGSEKFVPGFSEVWPGFSELCPGVLRTLGFVQNYVKTDAEFEFADF